MHQSKFRFCWEIVPNRKSFSFGDFFQLPELNHEFHQQWQFLTLPTWKILSFVAVLLCFITHIVPSTEWLWKIICIHIFDCYCLYLVSTQTYLLNRNDFSTALKTQCCQAITTPIRNTTDLLFSKTTVFCLLLLQQEQPYINVKQEDSCPHFGLFFILLFVLHHQGFRYMIVIDWYYLRCVLICAV